MSPTKQKFIILILDALVESRIQDRQRKIFFLTYIWEKSL